MKQEWRKSEKALYLPKAKAEKLTVPALKFITIKGEGNPNDSKFAEYIAVLYSLSYAIKMALKKPISLRKAIRIIPFTHLKEFGILMKKPRRITMATSTKMIWYLPL